MHYFEQLENAALKMLAEPLKNMGVRSVDIYAGQLNDAAKLKSIVNRLPCVWVLSGDINTETVNQTQEPDLELVVLTAAQSARGSNTAAKGAKRPGAYDILEVVRQTLNGKYALPRETGFSPLECFFEGRIFSAPEEGLVIFSTNFNLKTKVKGYY